MTSHSSTFLALQIQIQRYLRVYLRWLPTNNPVRIRRPVEFRSGRLCPTARLACNGVCHPVEKLILALQWSLAVGIERSSHLKVSCQRFNSWSLP